MTSIKSRLNLTPHIFRPSFSYPVIWFDPLFDEKTPIKKIPVLGPMSLGKSFLLRLFNHLENGDVANFSKLRSTFKLQIQLAMRQKEKKK